MSFNREDVQRRLDRRRARGACHIADTDLCAALAEIERLDGNLKDVLQNKLKPLQQELQRAYESTARQRERAEQAEARAAASHDLANHNFTIGCEHEARAAALQQERDAAEAQCAEHQHGENEALNRAERLTEALRQIAEHPHISYDHPANSGSTWRDYGIGCADGHRCAALIAAAALREEA